MPGPEDTPPRDQRGCSGLLLKVGFLAWQCGSGEAPPAGVRRAAEAAQRLGARRYRSCPP